MALIKCPECEKEISDKSNKCIHCGYPLINYICKINGVEYNLKEELSMALVDNNAWFKAIGSLRVKTSLTLSDADELITTIRRTGVIPTEFQSKYPLEDRSKYDKQRSSSGSGIPKCPTCQSTKIHRINGIERGASIAMFGIFSRKINKTFKCGNCGHTW